MTELLRALATLAEAPTDTSARLGDLLDLDHEPTPVEYTEFFLFQQIPYASVYLGAEGMVGGEARDRIAGFWRALSCEPPHEVDHLSTMLGAYADLCERHSAERQVGGGEQWLKARHAFLWEHLLSWLPAYLHKARAIAPRPFDQWADLLMEAMLEEARDLPAATGLPMHLRDVPCVADPRHQGADDFIAAVLTPVRSGMILTRADLLSAARALHAGVGIAGRQSVLRTLIDQEPEATIGWLSVEASQWEQFHAEQSADLGALAGFWHERAAATRKLLHGLQHDIPSGRV